MKKQNRRNKKSFLKAKQNKQQQKTQQKNPSNRRKGKITHLREPEICFNMVVS